MKRFLGQLDWKNPVVLALAVLVLFVLYQLVGGFFWFLIQTALYLLIFFGLLVLLKNKGFFK